MPDLIRTTLKHEAVAPGPEHERGSRFWSSAEVMASTWFVIETCIEGPQKNEIKRYIATSIHHAAQILQSQEPCVWSNIFIFLRVPLSVRNGVLFEKLDEAYRVKSSRTCLYRLENGMTFIAGQDASDSGLPIPQELELVYTRRR